MLWSQTGTVLDHPLIVQIQSFSTVPVRFTRCVRGELRILASINFSSSSLTEHHTIIKIGFLGFQIPVEVR